MSRDIADLDAALEHVESPFELVAVVHRRAQQLVAGAPPLVYGIDRDKLVSQALAEVETGELRIIR